MKKNLILTLFIVLAGGLLFSQEASQPQQGDQTQPPKEIIKKTYALQRAYAYQEEALLVSDTDNNGAYFIRREPLPEDIHVVGAQRQDDNRLIYGLNDILFIDAGSQSGLKEGDQLLVIGKQHKIRHPFTKGALGTYYLKKGLAVITCIYEDRAIIMMRSPTNPVEIGDLIIPHKPEPTIWTKKLIYSLCRIPPTPLEGRVVYEDIYTDLPRNIASDGDYLSIDLGEGLVEKGTFLLFYRVLRDDLPPFVIGLGIVIHPESNNSTAKVLDAYTDIRVGDHAAVLAATNALMVDTAKPEEEKKEEIPIVTPAKEVKKEAGKAAEETKGAAAQEERLMIDVYFDFDSKSAPASAAGELERVNAFIADKSEYLVILRGYTCSVGNDEYNLKLSQERVETIKSLLTSQSKVDAAHIETHFYGEKEPQFDNTQEAERKKNRLVKIEVVGK